MRVLYVDHTATVSGAQYALLDTLAALPEEIEAHVVCPEGDLADRVRALGVPCHLFAGTAGSLRGHAVQTPLAVAQAGSSAVRLARLARSLHVDLVHANSLRAGLIAAAVPPALRAPLVLHVHDRLPPGRASRAVLGILRRAPRIVLAISRYTAEDFTAVASKVRVVHNPIDIARFGSATVNRGAVRAALGVAVEAPLAGVVAQITPWKGQDDAIRAVALARATSDPALELLVVGEPKFVARATRYDNVAYLRSLHQLADELGISHAVHFLGQREDVHELIATLDVLLAPSWEEPLGRTVLEAMACGTAVVATNVGGPAEVITDGIDGRVLPPRRPDAWGRVLGELLHDRGIREAMAERARAQVVARFGRVAYSERLIAIYEQALRRPMQR